MNKVAFPSLHKGDLDIQRGHSFLLQPLLLAQWPPLPGGLTWKGILPTSPGMPHTHSYTQHTHTHLTLKHKVMHINILSHTYTLNTHIHTHTHTLRNFMRHKSNWPCLPIWDLE